MKKCLIILLLLFSSIFGQNKQYLDSLKNEMKFSSGKKLVGQYYDLIRYYTQISPEDAIATGRTAVKIAKDNQSQFLGKIYLLMTSNFSTMTMNDSAMHYSELALEVFKDQKDTLGISQAYLNKGVNYDIVGKPDKALESYEKARVMAETVGLEDILAAIYINSGVILLRKGEYSGALNEYLKALEIDEKSGNLNNITNSYINLGSVLLAANNYEKASDYFYKALDLAEKVDNKSNLLYIHREMANLYKLKQDYKSAMEQIDDILDIATKINQKLFYSVAVLEKIDVLITTNKVDQVDSLFTSVQNNVFDLSSFELTAQFYEMKCRYAILKSDYNLALRYHELAVDQLEQHYYTPEKRLDDQIRLGKIKANLGQSDEAIKIIYDVIDQCKRIEDLEIKANAYEELYQIYEQMEDYKNAFLSLKNFTTNLDTLQSLHNKSNIEELEIIHNIQKQNQENELIKKEKVIVESRLKSQRIIITTFLFITLISGFGVIYVSKSLINKRKTNEKLVLQNDTIIAQKMELEKFIASKDRLYSIIGHDLYSAHSNIASFINILNRNMEKLDKNFLSRLTSELKGINDSSLVLLDTLVEWGKIQTKKQTFNPTRFNLKAVIHTNLMLFKKNIEDKEIEINNDTDVHLELFGDKSMIGTVIRNIVSNAIKFTPKKGKIDIESQKIGDSIEIKFEDTGIGIKPDILPKLFQIENTITTRGTSGEKGHGLGLIICKELVELHGGDIIVESKLNEKTKVTIRIPGQ